MRRFADFREAIHGGLCVEKIELHVADCSGRLGLAAREGDDIPAVARREMLRQRAPDHTPSAGNHRQPFLSHYHLQGFGRPLPGGR